jgi:hypothetical protein
MPSSLPELNADTSDVAEDPIDWPARLIPLVGERTLFLHGPSPEEAEAGLSGRDLDCAIDGLDPMWPLRLPEGWRLCQVLHYDLKGWYWVVERQGEVLALDTIDDPKGFGRDGIRTHALLNGSGTRSPAAVRAAYLTVKRTRKSSLDEREWQRIGSLARQDSRAFLEALNAVAGPHFVSLVGETALAGRPPVGPVAMRATLVRDVRRFGSPARVLAALALGWKRYAERIWQPRGMFVLMAGPDGSGKSTLAERLPDLCHGIFKRHHLSHWRPNVLPPLSSLVGSAPPDPSQPHGRTPRGFGASLVPLAYYWLDFAVGGMTRDWKTLVRAGLLVQERGWWDFGVDPRRYRVSVSPRLIRWLGSFVRQPQLAIVLEAPPEVLLSRKAELDRAELARQMTAWRHVLPSRTRKVFVDASRPFDEIAHVVRERILQELEARSVARLGSGWLALPNGHSPRWWLPRGPAGAAVGALCIYQPVTLRGRAGWEAARRAGSLGAFRMLPRGSAPPREVRRALAPHLPPRSTIVASRSNHRGRYVALIVGDRGRLHAMAKVATGIAGREALAREVAAIERLGPLLSKPLSAPRVLATAPGLALLEVVRWRPRPRPWQLDEDLAAGLGAFFKAGRRGEGADEVGPAHGDFAPWNVLRTIEGRWALVDWESASDQAPPFHDLCHYIVQAHSLLGRPSRDAVLQGLRYGHGHVGRAIQAYAEEADLHPADCTRHMKNYLRATNPTLRPNTAGERRGLSRRRRLLEALGG